MAASENTNPAVAGTTDPSAAGSAGPRGPNAPEGARASSANPGQRPGPAPADDARLSGLRAVMALEDRVRQAADEAELVHVIANEARRLVAARQMFVLTRTGARRFRIAAVSSVAAIDRDTPFLRWIESLAARITAQQGDGVPVEFALPAFADPAAPETTSYPFRELLWQPMKLPGGETFAALLVARERPFTEADRRFLAREAQVFATCWQALEGPRKLSRGRWRRRWPLLAACTLVLAAAAVPVPMTTLAPVEIVAANARHVTAPIDGVLKDVLVQPNARVAAGDPIVLFDDTELRNRFLIAEREMTVARARYDRARQAAFTDEKARHDLAIALNDYRLKRAELDFAADQLARTTIVAARDGILIYPDKDRLLGRPVRTGQRLMEIADPGDVAARIDLPVADAIALSENAGVRLFLDAAPLTSIPASLKASAYHAEPDASQQLVYRLQARIEGEQAHLRIGARGTAQLYGDDVPLIYFLLRRPIAAVRQYIGL